MKLRIGFVSNSSSSSFVINDSAYKDVFELASFMIDIRANEDDYWIDSGKKIKSKLDEARKNGMDPDVSVSFSTANYDTYIKKYKEYYLVATSRNHLFHVELCGINDSEGLKNKIATELGFERWDDLEFHLGEREEFWFIDIDVIGRMRPWGQYEKKGNNYKCNKCQNDYDIIVERDSGALVCKDCKKEEIFWDNT